MDQYLPGEMLAQIATFLSKKDCNSLARTSKTTYNKLNSFRNLLPKAKLKIEVDFIDGMNSIHAWNRNDNMFVELVSSPPSADETEARSHLLTYFQEHKESPREDIFQLRYHHGLALSLDLLFSYFDIKSLVLSVLTDDTYEEIARYMRENRRGVTSLHFLFSPLPTTILQLTSACQPERLTVEGDPLPEGFYQATVIKRLSQLRVYTTNNSLNDRDLLNLGCVNLYFNNAPTFVTIHGILSFLSEWIVGKREIKKISVKVRWTLSAEEWRGKFAELNQDLVEININQEIFIIKPTKLVRKSDRLAMEVFVSRNRINMRVK